MKTIHFLVSGRVQGVFFRASTRKKANDLHLSGWVKNCDDGNVEGVARGNAVDLEKLTAWLATGPDLARVDKLIVEEMEDEDFGSFEIR